MELRKALLGALLVELARAHGDGMGTSVSMSSSPASPTNGSLPAAPKNHDHWDVPNYAGLDAYSGYIMAHIIFSILAWFFVLPIGIMFSIARSRLALMVQFLFLALNAASIITAVLYNVSTPDLYVNNAHHKIGWIATWIVTAHVVMSLLFLYSRRGSQDTSAASERAAFLPSSLHRVNRPAHKHSWSGDSGQGTEPGSARSSRTLSPARDYDYTKPELEEPEMDDVPLSPPARPSWFKNSKIDSFLSQKIPRVASQKVLKVAETASEIVDRTVLILGFVALTTGIVTYTGIFRDNNVFNGLAHWIKGGIFFWYGLLTLGRWLGSFADFGWAWNLKPTRSQVGWKARIPTAEFVESFVIGLYGFSNMFLEHLAAWGGAWTAQDFEHVSISIMFFGGGLAGMLVESTRMRRWLNTSVDLMPDRAEGSANEAQEAHEEPRQYTTSLNIMPALIILLLGIMMSSHHQDSMVSTVVHKQWGTLLSCFSLCRGLTYLTMYLSPPKSIYPSRPPTELGAAFCLISGGLVFMLSTKDIMHYIDVNHIMPMFIFTIVMGFSAFLVAWQILCTALKGWAVRREHRRVLKNSF